MSENLEVVRSVLAHGERGELLPSQWSELADPKIEFPTVGGPGRRQAGRVRPSARTPPTRNTPPPP
jgi:hypothetical protein